MSVGNLAATGHIAAPEQMYRFVPTHIGSFSAAVHAIGGGGEAGPAAVISVKKFEGGKWKFLATAALKNAQRGTQLEALERQASELGATHFLYVERIVLEQPQLFVSRSDSTTA